jgi:hypothetical protein
MAESKVLHQLHQALKPYLYFFTVLSDLEFNIAAGSLVLNSFKPIHGIALMPLGVYGLSTNQLNGNTHLGVFECKTYVVSFLLGRLLIDHDRSRVICIHRRLLLHFFTRNI